MTTEEKRALIAQAIGMLADRDASSTRAEVVRIQDALAPLPEPPVSIDEALTAFESIEDQDASVVTTHEFNILRCYLLQQKCSQPPSQTNAELVAWAVLIENSTPKTPTAEEAAAKRVALLRHAASELAELREDNLHAASEIQKLCASLALIDLALRGMSKDAVWDLPNEQSRKNVAEIESLRDAVESQAARIKELETSHSRAIVAAQRAAAEAGWRARGHDYQEMCVWRDTNYPAPTEAEA